MLWSGVYSYTRVKRINRKTIDATIATNAERPVDLRLVADWVSLFGIWRGVVGALLVGTVCSPWFYDYLNNRWNVF